MKIALITPKFVANPSFGASLRLHQLQTLLERSMDGGIAVWDLSRNRSVTTLSSESGQRAIAGNPETERSSQPDMLRDICSLLLHAWPSFTAKSLGAQRNAILAWIESTRPTHALIVHPYATDLVPALRQRGIRVFIDCQNVESDLARQLATLSRSSRQRLSSVARWRVIRRWETRFFPLADEVWLPSEIDAERQRQVCSGRVRTRCVPNALDVAAYAPRSGGGTHDVVLPGSFAYPPNVVGARILRDEVMPLVRQSVPDARLLLVGRDPEGLAQSLRREPDVVVTGEVPDTKPYIRRAGVVAVPIRQGGGTRYKILEAMALGVPVVTTPLGCEGLGVRDGEHLVIRDIDQFAASIVSILGDPTNGEQLGANGRGFVEAHYSFQVVEEIIRRAMDPASTIRFPGHQVQPAGAVL